MATFSLHRRLQEPVFLGPADRQLAQLPLVLPQADSDLVYDDVSAVAATSDPARRRNTEADDDVQYSIIQFKDSKEAEVAPYASVQSPRAQTAQKDVQSPYASVQSPHGKTAQEDVQYAAVNFSRPKDMSQ